MSERNDMKPRVDVGPESVRVQATDADGCEIDMIVQYRQESGLVDVYITGACIVKHGYVEVTNEIHRAEEFHMAVRKRERALHDRMIASTA